MVKSIEVFHNSSKFLSRVFISTVEIKIFELLIAAVGRWLATLQSFKYIKETRT